MIGWLFAPRSIAWFVFIIDWAVVMNFAPRLVGVDGWTADRRDHGICIAFHQCAWLNTQ